MITLRSHFKFPNHTAHHKLCHLQC